MTRLWGWLLLRLQQHARRKRVEHMLECEQCALEFFRKVVGRAAEERAKQHWTGAN